MKSVASLRVSLLHNGYVICFAWRSRTVKSTNPEASLFTLVITWISVVPLLVMASQGGFSFEQGSSNTLVGYAATGIISPINANEALFMKVQRAVLYLVCILMMAPFLRTIAREILQNKLIVSILSLALLSVIWSQNAWTSLLSATALTLDVCFGVYLLKRFSGNKLLKLLLLTGIIAAAASLLLVFVFPEYGLQGKKLQSLGAWQGIFQHKNACGSVLTIFLLPVFFVRIKSRFGMLLRCIYGAILVFIIAMTRSTGAWLVCAACVVFILGMRLFARFSNRAAVAVGMLITAFVLCASYVGFQYSDLLMYLMGKDPTMTGRTVIWAVLLPSILKHPLLGYGYMAFWQGGLKGESANAAIALNWPGISYSESGIIDLWLGLGAVAVVLFLLLFCLAARDAIYCFSRGATPIAMWFTSMLFYIAVSNIAAGQILQPSSLGCILQIVAFVGLGQERRRTRTESQPGALA